ncbi:hypothetical protein ABH917_002134 [Thermobifida halotolerans]
MIRGVQAAASRMGPAIGATAFRTGLPAPRGSLRRENLSQVYAAGKVSLFRHKVAYRYDVHRRRYFSVSV